MRDDAARQLDHEHRHAPADEAASVRTAVAANMRRQRLARGLSLRDMSATTGLSTALLSQIEREVANPTVAVLTKVAQALDITFAELTRSALAVPEIVRGANRADGASGARLLFSMMERKRFDLSEGVLSPGQAGVFSDHGRGSIEYGYVVAGSVTLRVGDDEFVLDAGDCVRFAAEVQHAYSTGTDGCTLLTVVAYADE
jgi:transcriptional regulator with XRE-family HTH domain